MEKFPYVTEHGPINLPFAWDGKESGDFPRYVTEIIESSSRIKPRTPLFSPPPPHRGTISAVFPKSITEAPSHPGRGRENGGEGTPVRGERGRGRPASRQNASGRAPLGSKRRPLLHAAPERNGIRARAPRADAARPFARGFGEGEPRPRGALGAGAGGAGAGPSQAETLVEHEHRQAELVEHDAQADRAGEGAGYRGRPPELPVAGPPAHEGRRQRQDPADGHRADPQQRRLGGDRGGRVGHAGGGWVGSK